MASYGGELLLDSSSPWSGVSSLSYFSIPLPFIFQEAKESIDEEDPRPTSSYGAYITLKRSIDFWKEEKVVKALDNETIFSSLKGEETR